MKVEQEKRDEIFAEVYAKTNSPSKAMIAAEPALKDNPHYAAVKANRTLKKSDIQHKIQQKLEKQAKTAMKNVDDLLISDDETIKAQTTWRVIEQLRGKPVARNLNMNAQVTIEDALFD